MSMKSCLTCGYSTLDPQQCPLIGYSYTEDRNTCCPYWIDKLRKCVRCDRIIVSPNPIVINKDNTWGYICENCISLSGTCGGCLKSTTCDFETNPSPIPKAVQKRIQQGNQIMVTTVKNEARVLETCAKNCDCFDHENKICSREYNCCKNYTDTIY